MNINQYEGIFHKDLIYELQMWEDVKEEMNYPADDNNNGLIYGIYWLDDNYEVVDVEWFRSEEERYAEVIKTNKELEEEHNESN